jgi:ElaB/YqjD/DUF883 family membrane-anchored ribosome-binding protein
MDHESEEVIKQQMLETRASLAEKLETLEQQVAGTVHNVSAAVTDTVDGVKESVQQTVDLAKASVQDTVTAVRDTLDLSRQVRQHPWLMVGCSISVGFAAGRLLGLANTETRDGHSNGSVPTLATLAAQSEPERDGPARTSGGSDNAGLLGELGRKLEPELNMLKGLALATVLGVARDMIADAAPPELGSQLAQIIDSATLKLGGQPIRGPVLARGPLTRSRNAETTPAGLSNGAFEERA